MRVFATLLTATGLLFGKIAGATVCDLNSVLGSIVDSAQNPASPLLTKARQQFEAGNPQEAIWMLRESGGVGEIQLARQFEEQVLQSLTKGKITKKKGIGDYDSYLVTLEDGTRAVFKPQRDPLYTNAKSEVAAYEIDRLLGLDMVPPTSLKKLDGESGSIQLFLSNTKNSSGKKMSPDQKFFNYFIQIGDRGPQTSGNVLKTQGGKEVLIDHGYAFFTKEFELSPERYLSKMGYQGLRDVIPSKKVYQRLKNLDDDDFIDRLSPYLSEAQIDDLFERQEVLVKYVEKLIKQKGEKAIWPTGR